MLNLHFDLKTEDYNKLVKLYTQALYRFCCKMLDDKELAKDVIQDAFLKLWEYEKEVELDKAKSWLFTTSYRLCLNHLKRNKKLVSDEILASFTTSNTAPVDLNEILNDCLVLLSETQKSVLLLKDYEGFAYHEIANILNISEDSVKVHLFRARQKIKNYVRDLKFVI